MHRSDDDTTTPTVELSGADARSAGWALSGVTVAVLVIGLLVIRSTRSETGASDTIAGPRPVQVEVPTVEPRQRTIVLEPAELPDQADRRSQPRALPATDTAERQSNPPQRSASAALGETTSFGRL